jgi:transcriptional regulator of arginine metabolism
MPLSSRTRAARREILRQLLEQGPVATQQELVDALVVRGYVATQSSVSRDLRDLGAVKTAAGYELRPSEPATGTDTGVAEVAGLLRGFQAAGANLLVIKTATGAAQRVALALDNAGWPEIVGNVGGDDTIFTATPNARAQRALIHRIQRAIGRA